jgi:hypothetical protein
VHVHDVGLSDSLIIGIRGVQIPGIFSSLLLDDNCWEDQR